MQGAQPGIWALMSFRDSVRTAKKKRARGGVFTATNGRRSPWSVNRDLACARTVLNYFEALDILPKATERDISRACKRLPTPQAAKVFLKPGKPIASALEAAIRHDRSGVDIEVAPFVAFVLLSGCRLGEALRLVGRLVGRLAYQDAVRG